MTTFEIVAKSNPDCDICGSGMKAIYGGGWHNDVIRCTGIDCGAEIVFPTSTTFEEHKEEEQNQ